MVRQIADILDDAPSNWGKWGDDDEIGALNYLTNEQVLAGIQTVSKGETFSLGLPVGRPEGDPLWPGRPEIQHYMDVDEGHYEAGKIDAKDGRKSADDVVTMFLHGTTHVDALGHVWYGDELYNGYDSNTTKGGLEKGSIAPIGDHGIVGRGVLLDVARHRGVDALDKNERITKAELTACAEAQDVEVSDRDMLFVRTGWLETFYEEGADAFYEGKFREPGLTYSEELVEWFHDNEIPLLGTDTISNEQTISSETGTPIPLHPALIRDQGVLFNEMLTLEDLADDCAADSQYKFLFMASPLKFVQGTGSPVNPLAIK